uniref:Uncharacterized protein n=1 Tax=Eutreptiella gymnastica TaxID=73025 RepID=A0A7S4FQH6_9EUGL
MISPERVQALDRADQALALPPSPPPSNPLTGVGIELPKRNASCGPASTRNHTAFWGALCRRDHRGNKGIVLSFSQGSGSPARGLHGALQLLSSDRWSPTPEVGIWNEWIRCSQTGRVWCHVLGPAVLVFEYIHDQRPSVGGKGRSA